MRRRTKLIINVREEKEGKKFGGKSVGKRSHFTSVKKKLLN